MATTATVEQQGHAFGFIAKWWQNLRRRSAAERELESCGEPEILHLAHDLGVSPSELRTLAGRWPDSANLSQQRMDAIGIDATMLGRTQPEVLRDLQRVCGQCADERRCEHDLRRDRSDPSWRAYCPNVATFDALRSQERDRRWMRGGRKWRSF